MTNCPYCKNSCVRDAIIRKTGQSIKICFNCDTVWLGDISDVNACSGEVFRDHHELSDSVDEFEYLESIYNRSFVKIDYYFPLIVSMGKIDVDGRFVSADMHVLNSYMYFSKQTKSSIELTLDETCHYLKEIVLLLSYEYSITDEFLSINICEKGVVNYFEGDIKCEVFKTVVYSDGVKILLSSKPAVKYRRIDNVYIGVSDTNDIMEICVCNMNEAELEHLKTVLERQSH